MHYTDFAFISDRQKSYFGKNIGRREGVLKEDKQKKAREDIHCLTLKADIWKKAQELADDDGRSISSLFRELIKQLYQKKKRFLLSAR